MKRYAPYFLVTVLCSSIAFLCHAADEISVTVELQVVKDALEVERKPGTASIDMTGDSISDIVQSFPTGVVTLITIAAGVASNGVTFFQNITTNTDRFIDIGVNDVNTNFIEFGRIQATEPYIMRLHPTNSFYGLAVGGTVNLRTLVIED